jgi:hypothetical protein
MDRQAQTDLLTEFFTTLRSTLAVYRDLLDKAPSGNPEVANFKDGVACLELAITFHEEANRAVQAEAWFAASAVAGAALEALLLTKMFMSTNAVGKLASFKKLLDNHRGDFGSFARGEMNLGKLLDVAEELSWYPAGGVPAFLTEMMAQHVEQETLTALTGVFKDHPSAGLTSAHMLRQYRNLLHPAVCLKLDVHPTKETGIRATFFCLVAFAAISGVQDHILEQNT